MDNDNSKRPSTHTTSSFAGPRTRHVPSPPIPGCIPVSSGAGLQRSTLTRSRSSIFSRPKRWRENPPWNEVSRPPRRSRSQDFRETDRLVDPLSNVPLYSSVDREGSLFGDVGSIDSASVNRIDLPGGPIPLYPCEPYPSWAELRQEAKNLLTLSLPVTGAYILQYSIAASSVFFIGHLGAVELAAAALGNMFASVTGYAIASGLNTALDTLCSQAYTGADDVRMVGVHLQRGLVLMAMLMLPVSVVWWNAETIFLALHQDPTLAALCGQYLRYQLWGALPYFMFECIKRFLQGQGIMHATTYILLFLAPVNVILNYFLVWYPPLSLGFIGAPIATSISFWIMLILAILYVKFVDGKEAWGGWDRRCLQDWKMFMGLAIPGMIMVCCEWWAFEIVALSSSYLGTLPLAAQSILLTTDSMLYQLSLGIGISVNTRVGHLLGAGLPRAARLSSFSGYGLALFTGLLNSGFLILARHQWGYFFNEDPGVAEIVASVMPIMALCQTCDVIAAVGSGILRGQGRQRIGAILNLLSYYMVAIPMGIVLAYPLGLGAAGLWWGLCASLFIVACGQVLATWWSDWDEIVELCQDNMFKLDWESYDESAEVEDDTDTTCPHS
ncbi:ethionine resistance protein [Dispira simplex]|nr:ethionine resistance protein [Dispira simplex]